MYLKEYELQIYMSKQYTLFPLPERYLEAKPAALIHSTEPRINSSIRNQFIMRCASLDGLLPVLLTIGKMNG